MEKRRSTESRPVKRSRLDLYTSSQSIFKGNRNNSIPWRLQQTGCLILILIYAPFQSCQYASQLTMDAQIDVQMDAQMALEEWVERWMTGQMDGCSGGQMDKWIDS